MAREQRWEPFGPVALTLDGGADGKITIPNTCGLHTKQVLIFKSSTIESVKKLEVKKVISSTEFIVGPIGKSISTCQDMSAFTIADGTVVWTQEQPRPNITPHEIARAEFEEEPVVAKRTIPVNKLGEIVDIEVLNNKVIEAIANIPSSGGSGGNPNVCEELAAVDISALKLVSKTSDGKIELAQPNSIYSKSRVLGVAISSGVASEMITVQTFGKLDNILFDFGEDVPLFLGVDGTITDIPESSGFHVEIGYSTNDGQIFINIQDPIEL